MERPVNLKIASISFPVPAIVSILHRLSGLLLFFFIPFVLWLTWYSLSSEQHFDTLKYCLSCFWLRLIIWLFISALFYHFVAGVRHLLMDIHVGDGHCSGRLGAWLVFIISAIIIALLAVYLLIGINQVVG